MVKTQFQYTAHYKREKYVSCNKRGEERGEM
jgi:hypothetical protein